VIENVASESNIRDLQDINIEGKAKVGTHANFHVLPKGFVPPSGPSHGGTPPSPDLQSLNQPHKANNVIKAPADTHVIKNMHFHVLPKGPVPPSGPSHGCTPPCAHLTN